MFATIRTYTPKSDSMTAAEIDQLRNSIPGPPK